MAYFLIDITLGWWLMKEETSEQSSLGNIRTNKTNDTTSERNDYGFISIVIFYFWERK